MENILAILDFFKSICISFLPGIFTVVGLLVGEFFSLRRSKADFNRKLQFQLREKQLEDLTKHVKFIEDELQKYIDRFYFMLEQIRNTTYSNQSINKTYTQDEAGFVLENIREDPKIVSVFVYLDPQNELVQIFFDLLTQVIKMNNVYEDYFAGISDFDLSKRTEILLQFQSDIKRDLFNKLSDCYEKLYEAKEMKIKKIYDAN